MTERVIEIPAGAGFELPTGWYFKEVVNARTLFTPLQILITDQPGDHPYNPDNVVYGEGYLDIEEPHVHMAQVNGYGNTEYHPDYYQTENMEPWDIIKEFQLNYWTGTAVSYLCRAGKKPGEPEINDIRKAYTFLSEYLRYLETNSQAARESPGPTYNLPVDDPRHRCIQGLCDEHAGPPSEHP